MATRAVMGKAIYLAPLAFAAGLALKEWRDTQKVHFDGDAPKN